METLTYNQDDYSGKEATVSIFKNGNFKGVNGIEGTIKITSISNHTPGEPKSKYDIFQTAKLVLKGEHEGYEQTAHKFDGDVEWFCTDYGIERSDKNPLVAMLQIIHNTV